jgi:hypothetical protein
MSDRLVTVATFQEPVAAQLARNVLESAGIPAVLFDEDTIATDWMLATAIGGIKLQVARIHLERAELLLSKTQPEEEEVDPHAQQTAFASQEIAEELRADREDLEPINQHTDRLFRVAVFGLLLWPLQFYAIWLLMEILSSDGTVSTNRRWKVWLSLPMIAAPLVLMTSLGVKSWCLL